MSITTQRKIESQCLVGYKDLLATDFYLATHSLSISFRLHQFMPAQCRIRTTSGLGLGMGSMTRRTAPLILLTSTMHADCDFWLPSSSPVDISDHDELNTVTEPSTPTPRARGHRKAQGLRREQSARFLHVVLHYDRAGNDLTPWYWYVNRTIRPSYPYSNANTGIVLVRPVNEDGERIVPSELLEHRRTHEFRGPSCLCASLDSSDLGDYTEAAIFVATVGPSSGQYVAACASGQCRYWGTSHFAHGTDPPSHLLGQSALNKYTAF
jgi:hypothetical protein